MTWSHTVYLDPEGPDRRPVHCEAAAPDPEGWVVLRAVGCELRAPGQPVARSRDGRDWYHRDGSPADVWTRRRDPAWGPRAPRYPAWIPVDGRMVPVVVERGDLVGGRLRVTDAPWPRRRAP